MKERICINQENDKPTPKLEAYEVYEYLKRIKTNTSTVKAPPKNANRGNERQFKLRTLNSSKNMDENKQSRGNKMHIRSLRHGVILRQGGTYRHIIYHVHRGKNCRIRLQNVVHVKQ